MPSLLKRLAETVKLRAAKTLAVTATSPLQRRLFSTRRSLTGTIASGGCLRRPLLTLQNRPSALKACGSSAPSYAARAGDDDSVFRRDLYDHDDWNRHRSNTRHGRHMLAIPSSRVVTGLLPPVISVTLFASALSAFNSLVMAGNTFPHWVPLLHIAPLPFQITSPAIALLLIFRTNTSYARFDDARKVWASIVIRSRDVIRQAASFSHHPDENARLEAMARYLVAFSYCLKDSLTPEDDLRKDLSGVLQKEELERVMSSPQRLIYILQEVTQTIHNSNLSSTLKAMMDSNVTKFHDYVGACERIFSTPIPVSFTRLTSRLLIIWHFLLPLALWDECYWITVPATFLSAAALFCIEQVGVVIEEPFAILPLSILCRTTQKNIETIIEEHQELKTKPRYTMNNV